MSFVRGAEEQSRKKERKRGRRGQEREGRRKEEGLRIWTLLFREAYNAQNGN